VTQRYIHLDAALILAADRYHDIFLEEGDLIALFGDQYRRSMKSLRTPTAADSGLVCARRRALHLSPPSSQTLEGSPKTGARAPPY
jgi:hypothetical protein